jgi:peptidoglycan hydrolase-like protein with peptidoglycan-binding domain
MRTTLYKVTVVGSLLAVLAASICTVHAAATQVTTTLNKSTKSSSANHSTAAASSGSTKSGSASSKPTGTSTGHKTSAKSSSRKNTKSRKVKGQAAPTPDRINEIQVALAKNGAYDGTPSGKWDDSTADAMRKFQSSHGLNPSGKLDAPTLQKLGLGSETAGVAAPTPPANAGANRLLSSRAQQDHPDTQSDQPDK